jgi:hypothetical protein
MALMVTLMAAASNALYSPFDVDINLPIDEFAPAVVDFVTIQQPIKPDIDGE